MPQPRILVIGEALIDIVREASGAEAEHVGGSPANVAVGLARLEHPVRLATAVGGDERGERIVEHLTARGVELTAGSVTSHPTSTAQVTFDADRNATYEFDIHWNLAPVPVESDDVHLHAGSLATALEPGAGQAREAMATSREAATLSYDPNIRPGIMGDLESVKDGVEDLLTIVDVVKASSDDVELLYPGRSVEEVIDHWLSLGPALVVLTRGADGVTYRTRSSKPVSLPTGAGTVVDTVGAGDSFMAGLLSGLMSLGLLGGPRARSALTAASTDDVRPAIERGLSCSAVTVGHAGAYAPSPDEL